MMSSRRKVFASTVYKMQFVAEEDMAEYAPHVIDEVGIKEIHTPTLRAGGKLPSISNRVFSGRKGLSGCSSVTLISALLPSKQQQAGGRCIRRARCLLRVYA